MIELGAGAAAALAVAGAGRVSGVYTRAAYLHVPGGLVALTTGDAPPGPVHARVADVDLGGLRVGDRVVVAPPLVQAGPLLLDLAQARQWRGALPTAVALDGAAGTAIELLAGLGPSPLADSAGRLDDVHDVATAASRIGGLGPGLTPAGDDVLAGMLLVARIRWGPGVEAELVTVARQVHTNDVAAAFLAWAARGQCIEPVHRFLLAIASGARGEAADALATLVRFGHSSGADLAQGLRLGLARVRSRAAVVSPG